MSPLAELLRDVGRERATRGIAWPSVPMATVMQTLTETRYTGTLLLHLRDGIITEFDVPNMIKIRVC